jgi:hypothetical protein
MLGCVTQLLSMHHRSSACWVHEVIVLSVQL